MENLLENKDLIHQYLYISIIKQLNLDIDLTGEYIFTENLVSGKPIIATTFTDKILVNTELKMFLSSLIMELNTGNCSSQTMKKKLLNYPKSNFKKIRKAI